MNLFFSTRDHGNGRSELSHCGFEDTIDGVDVVFVGLLVSVGMMPLERWRTSNTIAHRFKLPGCEAPRLRELIVDVGEDNGYRAKEWLRRKLARYSIPPAEAASAEWVAKKMARHGVLAWRAACMGPLRLADVLMVVHTLGYPKLTAELGMAS